MKIGAILGTLHIFGNAPLINDLFIIVHKGMENVSWISSKIFVDMLFGPELLVFSKVFVKSNISLDVVGQIWDVSTLGAYR